MPVSCSMIWSNCIFPCGTNWLARYLLMWINGTRFLRPCRRFSSLDINLKTHEILGTHRALRGLWLAWTKSQSVLPEPLETTEDDPLHVIAMQLFGLIDNNPALQSPISDEQAVDIALALMLLGVHGGLKEAIGSWLDVLVDRTYAAYRTHGAYPTCKWSYWDLVEHPAEKTDEYRTGGSTLFPLLALWGRGYSCGNALATLAKFKNEHLEHCNFQLWFPDSDSEAGLYQGSDRHGDMLSNIPVDAEGVETRRCRYGMWFERQFQQIVGYPAGPLADSLDVVPTLSSAGAASNLAGSRPGRGQRR